MSALPSSRPDDLRQVALRVFSEIITGGDLALADVLIAPDYVDHRGGPPGRDGFKLGLQMIRAAFPDWSSTPEDMVVEGDKVAARWTVRGTHQGDFMGIPATGRLWGRGKREEALDKQRTLKRFVALAHLP